MQTIRQYRLGKNAALSVDGYVLQSVIDDSVRVLTDEMNVANGADVADSTLVYRRTIQIQVVLIDVREARFLGERLQTASDADLRPRLVVVELSGGHIARKFFATIHEADEDRGIRSVVATRWIIKQWGKQAFLDVEDAENG